MVETFSKTLLTALNEKPIPGELEGTCCMCGEHTNEGNKKKFGANFTCSDYLESGDVICPYCQHLVKNSNSYRRTMFLLTEHEFTKFKKQDLKDIIFNLPVGEDFYLYLTQTWQKLGYILMNRARNTDSTDSVAVGVLGLAGHTKYNVGVCGGLGSTSSSTNFAGIYGTKGMLGYVNFNSYTGHYAGFFYGNVRVTSGSIYATVLSPSATTNNGSMQNVNVISTDNIDGETVTNKLSQVQTIQFMRDKRELESVDEPVEIPADERARLTAEGVDVDAMQKEKRVDEPTLSAIQYGLAADQLKKVYPELVYEDKDGNVSINYIEMIPLLVQSIKNCSAYKQYRKSERDLRKYPGLGEKLDLLRGDIFEMYSNSPGDEMLENAEQLERTYQEMQKIPEVNAYLEAEADLCRQIRDIYMRLIREVGIHLPTP